MWLNQNFLLQEDIDVEGHSLNVNFLSLRGSGPLVVKMEQSGQVILLSEFVQIKFVVYDDRWVEVETSGFTNFVFYNQTYTNILFRIFHVPKFVQLDIHRKRNPTYVLKQRF